jgi:hypothetical protein
MTQEMKVAVAEELVEADAEATQLSSVVTRTIFAASPARVWKGLVFYEELGSRPPLLLRLLLPVPIRTDGRISEVGDETKCWYERGHLLKRITRIEQTQLYEFEVAEQQLTVGGRMRLSGGRYTLREVAEGQTEVEVETRYASPKWPRWFWEPLERVVCHLFHRYLLRSMRRKIETP